MPYEEHEAYKEHEVYEEYEAYKEHEAFDASEAYNGYEGINMSLEYLIKDWELLKKAILIARNEEEKDKYLKAAKSTYETALELYGVDLYEQYGGL